MASLCPSCSQPLTEPHTRGPSGETVGADEISVCGSCGFVLGNIEAAETCDIDGMQEATVSSRRVAHFQLDRQLGKGGFGEVWLAEDSNLGRNVALKLPRSVHKDAKLVHEAKTAAKLKHPNIVAIYEVGTAGNQVYIASEYIEGESLREIIDRERLPMMVAAQVVTDVANAVDHAHSHGVVHRDLKPANIMIDLSGQPHVTDFGIAKQLSDDETISTDGQIIGTVAYMSPEQARGNTRETDHRSDVYAIGTILFELLTEYRPFRGTPRGILHQKLNEDPPSPRLLVPQLPKDLETICLKCLEREPGKRYQSAGDIADELKRFQEGIPIRARPVSHVEKAIRWCKRNKTVCGLTSTIVASLFVGLLGTSFFWSKSERIARQRQQKLYRTRMVLASNQWSQGNITDLRSSLSIYATGQPGSELRGFEWHYLNNSLKPYRGIVDHGDSVTGVAVSYDNLLLASAGRDRVIRVWDLQSAELMRSLTSRGAVIGMIDFSPRSNRLLSTHRDGRVRIWNPMQHADEAGSFEHGPRLTVARFHPSGERIVSVDAMGTVRWWDAQSMEALRRVDQLENSVRSMAFSPDGTQIAIGTIDGAMVVVRESDGEVLHRIETKTPLRNIVFTGPQTLFGGGVDRVSFVDLQNKAEREYRSYEGEAVGDVTYLHRLGNPAVTLSNHNFSLIGSDRKSFRTLPTHSLNHGTLGQSRDGRLLAVGSGDGTVKVMEVDALRSPQILWHDVHVRDLAFVGGSDQVVTCTGDGAVHQWNTSTGEHQELLAPVGREMLTVAVNRKSGIAFAAGMMPEIAVIDLNEGRVRDPITLPLSAVVSLDVSPRGDRLAVGTRSGLALIYDLADTSKPRDRINRPETQITQLSFSPTGETLAIAYSDRQLTMVSLESSADPVHWQLDSVPRDIAFSPNGEQLVVATQTGELVFLYLGKGDGHLATGDGHLAAGDREVVDAHQGRINAIAFFPDGQRLVSAGRDKKINLWDVESREKVAVLESHERQIFCLDVAPDGRSFASAGLAGDLRLWRNHEVQLSESEDVSSISQRDQAP